MVFETHITVDAAKIQRWKEFCADAFIKPLLIQLSHGENPRQLMCSAPFSADHDEGEHKSMELRKKVEAAGFRVLRVKLECPLDYSAMFHYPAYYEFHMKLILDEAGAKKIPAVCQELGLRASRNLFSAGDGLQKWYLTGRDYMRNMMIVKTEFERSHRLTEQYLEVDGMDMECVIFDTNPGLDLGWIEKSG